MPPNSSSKVFHDLFIQLEIKLTEEVFFILYGGPHKWDNVLKCIFNQMEIQDGQIIVKQWIEGSNRSWSNKKPEDDNRISIRVWGTSKPNNYVDPFRNRYCFWADIEATLSK